MAILRMVFEVDTDKPLGPQLAVWRAYGMRWQPIVALLGISRRTLQHRMCHTDEASQSWERHRVRTEVIVPAPQGTGQSDAG